MTLLSGATIGSPPGSLVLGSDKRSGLRVYNLAGEELQHLPAGRINNVDLRALPDDPEVAAIAAGSNRTMDSISLFSISHTGDVTWLKQAEIETGLDDPYGLCMYRSADGALFVFVNDKDGRYQQWRLPQNPVEPGAQLVREFVAAGQPEGCVADDATHRLFYGVENSALMSVSADPAQPFAPLELYATGGGVLYADVEGMALYLDGDEGYLVVSSQGDNSYAVFDRQPPHAHRGSFRIEANLASGVDGASETDGLDVHSGSFGAEYPEGILVVQDGHNVMPLEKQNFKLLDFRSVLSALGLQAALP